ncbi:hypothetical protein [uncultured Methylobacterium sp.]|uniref:hypothetical protein n=1 Tax=uncultured Methylobacterium sp. TaxID=157278 RepID=UPI0035CA1CB3
MSRIISTSVLALALAAGLPAVALAQSYTAPAGIPAETAPGGATGRTVESRGWNAAPNAYDTLTTGSSNRRSVRQDRAVRH